MQVLLKGDRALESLQTGLELLHLLRSPEDLDAVGGAASGQEEGGGVSFQKFKANAVNEVDAGPDQEATGELMAQAAEKAKAGAGAWGWTDQDDLQGARAKKVEEMLTVYQEATNGAPDGARTQTGDGDDRDETLARSPPSPLIQQRDLGVVAVQQRDFLFGNEFSQVLSIETFLFT